MTFSQVRDAFAGRYASDTKNEEISARLAQLTLADCRENDDDDYYAALKSLIACMGRFVPIYRVNDRDEDEKVGFLREGVVGTPWGLRASSMLPRGYNFQDLINALKTSQQICSDMKQQPVAKRRGERPIS